tara:strand:- start:999 stop:1838 length:840 start_codon:yes stop_codon:yes gene_type:complete
MNNDDLIKIDISEFKNKLDYYIQKDLDINDKIIEKKQFLINNFNCFKDKYDSKFLWEKKKKKFTNIKTNKRIHTFTTNLTDTSKNKKLFISLLNKLTSNNKKSIISDIESIISTNDDLGELTNIVFTNISKNYNELYLDILYLIYNKNNKLIDNYYNDYINNNKWLLLNEYNDVNIMEEKNYELFCEYKKFKLSNKNILNSVIFFKSNGHLINNLIEQIIEKILIEDNFKSYVVNYYLELLDIFKKHITNNNYSKLEDLNINNYDKSTKFLYNNLFIKE